MNTQPDSTGPASPSPSDADSLAFELEELGRKDARWRLQIRPGDLALYEADDSQPYVILREQVLKEFMFVEGMRALVLKKPKKLTFKLAPEAVKAVADWIGKPALASFYLKRRYAWVLPLGLIWIVGAMPMPGNPESGLEPKPLDAMGLGLGLTLLVAWAFAKWRPHPVLFLMDSLWFLWLAGYLVHDIWQGRSAWWLILAILLLRLVVTGIKHFRRFRGTRLEHRKA